MLNYLPLIGRILFSAVFIIKSFGHFTSSMIGHAEHMGVPMAGFLVPVSGILMLIGGLSILLGYKGKLGAWLIVICLVPVTVLMHKFWQAEGAYSMMMEHMCFWKNISIIGGALMIAHFGTGAYSLDQR